MRLVRMVATALAGVAVIAAATAGGAAGAPKKLDMVWGMDDAAQLEPGEELRLNNTTSIAAETGAGMCTPRIRAARRDSSVPTLARKSPTLVLLTR